MARVRLSLSNGRDGDGSHISKPRVRVTKRSKNGGRVRLIIHGKESGRDWRY